MHRLFWSKQLKTSPSLQEKERFQRITPDTEMTHVNLQSWRETVWSGVGFRRSRRFTFMKLQALHKPSCGPRWQNSKGSDWSRCNAFVFNGILTSNVLTFKLANSTPTHLLRPLFTIFVESERQKSERSLGKRFGKRELMWKLSGGLYLYLERRWKAEIVVLIPDYGIMDQVSLWMSRLVFACGDKTWSMW